MATVTHANIHVENGQESGDSSRMAVHVLPKRGLRAGETLVMFLDLPDAPANVCADVIQTLREGYANAPGGVTSALRLAIKLANDQLQNANRGAVKPIEGSITCAVVGDGSVVLAQCGPALAYVRSRAGVFERIEPQGAAAEQNLGRSSTIDVYFDNVAHLAGTIYVLTGRRSFPQQNDRLVSACMGKGDAETVAAYLNVNVKQTMAALAFEVLLDDADDATKSMPEPVEAAAAEPTRPAPPFRKEPRPEPRPEPRTTAGDANDSPRADRREKKAQPAAAARRPLIDPQFSAGIARVLRSVGDGLGRFGGRMLPNPSAEPPQYVPARVKSTHFLAVAAMVLLPILVIGISVPVYLQISGDAERRETKQSIDAQLAAAQAARDPNDVRVKWTALQQQVAAYEAKYPEFAGDFAQVRTLARTQLDALVKTVRVAASPIAQFETTGRNRVASSAMGVYVLNADQGTANYLPLNDNHTALASQGMPVSLQFTDVDETNRGVVDIAWATNSDSRWRTEGAVLFGVNGAYEYSSATMRAAPWKIDAADAGRPARVAAGEIYNSTIYMLDAQVGQIWKYTIGGQQLKSAAPYFRAPYEPLKGAVDIGIDGAVYVLMQNGSVQKFFNKAPQAYTITGLPEPIGRATAMVVTGGDPERGNVYVLDSQAGSVIEFDKKGAYLRQYRGAGDEFVDATDLAVDMARRTGYVVTAKHLYTFKLQAVP